jgi:hypothetical protein
MFHTECGERGDYSRCGEAGKAASRREGRSTSLRSNDQERRAALRQHAGSAAVSASSMMRRMVRAHRPH